ncbi:hypothetical protein HALO59_50660 [Halomonas sp. 59]|nr:hypothetical protein HALO156_130422 [Halomonas sp. 156]CAD5288275.1 hypothetical protein HALO113_80663 [Halomonas sp. 113]CAD5289718.1 hypothetical protein HALO59_50660 [Halomonas sp. 59]CAD5292662.1 hypothetical protein HALOI3_60149 [Halomonas sp. I3]VXB44992.1 hypothetical protein HALO153_130489 [Halomonas titanicae]
MCDSLNQRDVIAVRKTVSGLLKQMFPHGEYMKDDIRECLEYAMQVRRRVKERLKRMVAWSSTMSTSATLTKRPWKSTLCR